METKEGNNMDALLVKQLLGEASEDELQMIRDWLTKSIENQRYSKDFDSIWQRSKQLALQSTVDENAAWERFKLRTSPKDVPVIPLPQSGWRSMLRIAAILFVLVGTGWLVYFFSIQNQDVKQIVTRSDVKPLIDTLPDGSIVTLNAQSSISYPEVFRGDTRPVTLIGEAFFQVAANKEMPFTITANNVTVRVVGTSFNVKTSIEKTEVIVETGVVEVARQQQKVTLKPEQKVIIRKDKQEFDKEITRDTFYNYYRSGKLVCDDTPLWRLVEMLNEIYGTNIVVEGDSLKRLPINTTFEAQSLENTLTIISETFNIKVVRNGKQIILQ